ncbi:MAG TPA: ATP-binding protein, partial [Candidatus Cloacimonadota bacterium]|nr:ATP-binding protein [Candidatus Cloacimonadota bacterium]
MPENTYTASNIKVLKGLEAVRKRPAMYIGGTSERGLHHLVYEVVDNSIDEALGGYCDLIKVTITSDGNIEVDDNGRGIPVDIQKDMGVPAVQVVLTVLHAGGKFDQNSYKVSGGLHGVGVSVVNALSEWFEVRVHTNGKEYFMRLERGIPVTDLQVMGSSNRKGTVIKFKPDTTIFETTEFSFDYLTTRLRELAFLNRGVRIILKDERNDRMHDFKYDGGINSFVEYLNQNKKPIFPKPIHIESEREGMEFEVSLQYNDGYQENIFSFANNINTIEGGTHLSGFKRGLTS